MRISWKKFTIIMGVSVIAGFIMHAWINPGNIYNYRHHVPTFLGDGYIGFMIVIPLAALIHATILNFLRTNKATVLIPVGIFAGAILFAGAGMAEGMSYPVVEPDSSTASMRIVFIVPTMFFFGALAGLVIAHMFVASKK